MAITGKIKSWQKTKPAGAHDFDTINLVNDLEAIPIAGLWEWVTYVNEDVNGNVNQVPITASNLIDVSKMIQHLLINFFSSQISAGEPEYLIYFTIGSTNHEATFLWDPVIGYQYVDDETTSGGDGTAPTAENPTDATEASNPNPTSSSNPINTQDEEDPTAAASTLVASLVLAVLALLF